MAEITAFFSSQPETQLIYAAVCRAVESIGPAQVKVSKSQIAFVRRKPFASVWIPEQYLHRQAAPLVLTLGFRFRDPSPRWKSIVEAAPGRFTHHLELYHPTDIDAEVLAWLKSAWDAAG